MVKEIQFCNNNFSMELMCLSSYLQIVIEDNMNYHSASGHSETNVQFPISPIRAKGPSKLSPTRTSNAREQWPDRQIGSQPESPLHIGAKFKTCNLAHALDYFQAGNYLAAMKTCRVSISIMFSYYMPRRYALRLCKSSFQSHHIKKRGLLDIRGLGTPLVSGSNH